MRQGPITGPVAGTAGTVAFSCAYPAVPAELAVIRDDLRRLLNGCPAADDVILCASELAANASLHSNSRKPGGVLTLRAEIRRGEYVRIEIGDRGGPWDEPGLDPERPHGLDLIAAFAAAWGIVDTAAGRTVWARLHWNPAT
jgi:serine/threonine-protein kinase RsbW